VEGEFLRAKYEKGARKGSWESWRKYGSRGTQEEKSWITGNIKSSIQRSHHLDTGGKEIKSSSGVHTVLAAQPNHAHSAALVDTIKRELLNPS